MTEQATIRDARRSWLTILVLIAIVVAGMVFSAIELTRTANTLFSAPPISYPEQPIPVEDPTHVGMVLKGTLHTHAGSTPVFLPYRCIADDGGTGLGVLVYTYTHSLINENLSMDDPARKADLPGGTLPGDVGCRRTQSLVNTVPVSTKPGLYHFEGYSSAYNGQRFTQVFWYTVSFIVDP